MNDVEILVNGIQSDNLIRSHFYFFPIPSLSYLRVVYLLLRAFFFPELFAYVNVPIVSQSDCQIELIYDMISRCLYNTIRAIRVSTNAFINPGKIELFPIII